MKTLNVLGLVFVVLKLLGAITWPWWAVLIPWYPMFFFLSLSLVMLLMAGILTGTGALLGGLVAVLEKVSGDDE